MELGVYLSYHLTLISALMRWISTGQDVGSESLEYLTQGHPGR